MLQKRAFSRRAFLRNAGMGAFVGTVGTSPPLASAAASNVFDFDTPCNRVGTSCVKWDRQIERFGKGKIEVGMGIADMDFKAAPCIGRALAERCRHENWGYLHVPASYIEAIAAWKKKRHGIDVDPNTIVLSDGAHPALIAALKTFSPPGSRILLYRRLRRYHTQWG